MIIKKRRLGLGACRARGPGGVHGPVSCSLAREYAVDAKTDVSTRALALEPTRRSPPLPTCAGRPIVVMPHRLSAPARRIGHQATMFRRASTHLAASTPNCLSVSTKISETVGQPFVGVTLGRSSGSSPTSSATESLSPADLSCRGAAGPRRGAGRGRARLGCAAWRYGTWKFFQRIGQGPGDRIEFAHPLPPASPPPGTPPSAASPPRCAPAPPERRHLVLAARIVLGKVGGTPDGDVAEALRRRVRELAAEESA